jgi:hypothetical protein
MKSPVILFYDPAAAIRQRAKLLQEGIFIPTFINLFIMKHLQPLEQKKSGEKRTKKS